MTLSEKNQLITDDFSQACRRGQVVGSQSVSDRPRLGADVEKLLSIDNGALRIQPPIHPGWGRTGVAYGPYQRQAGLTLAVFMLNGHNASEGNSIEETLKGRFFRWLRGSEAKSIGNRLVRWAMSSQHSGTSRQFYRWIRNHKHRFKAGHLQENLAVGWFSDSVPSNPTAAGNSIVVRADGPESGALYTRSGDHLMPVFKGLQNLQTYYIVVLREQGAAYYAASLPNAYGFSAYPDMRLIGIDSQGNEDTVYAALYQSALGQVGFRVDTRVYGMHTVVLPGLSAWYGTAQAADLLTGSGSLDNATTALGQSWQVLRGHLQKTPQGVVASSEVIQSEVNPLNVMKSETSNYHLALLREPAPSGVIYVVITGGEQMAACALLWRTQDEDNTWALFFENGQCQLKLRENGEWLQMAVDSRHGLRPGISSAVQVLDSDQSFSLYVDGDLLFETEFTDARLQEMREDTYIGLLLYDGCDAVFQRLESHPRDIPIPPELKMGAPWQVEGTQVLLADSFVGEVQDLSEHVSDTGSQCWRKEMGSGRVLLSGKGTARVDAAADRPNPGRLAYTVNWDNPELADLSVDILPPGTDRYQREKGRGGLIFWQDPDHYIIVNQWLDDSFNGSSLSSFFHIDGFEEAYDAVWTNTGSRIYWGRQYTLRVTFDGLNFVAYINEEPVLYRALTDIYPRIERLSIRRVGIVANWEWGNDTGSVFSCFVGKA